MPNKFSSHLIFSTFTVLQIYIKVHIIVDCQENWTKDFYLALFLR